MAKAASSTPVERRTRADAQRNRERILEVAREAFIQHGAEASLDEIARRAGLGPGTLYRHFPTRDLLIEAVFRDQVAKLTEASKSYAATMQPLEALRSWMLLFVDYVACKLLIMPAMNTVPGGSTRMIEGTRNQVHGALRALVQRAIQSGDLNADLQPEDFSRAFFALFQTTFLPGWEQSVRRIVDILIEGSRSGSSHLQRP